jgi:hypothetical protein
MISLSKCGTMSIVGQQSELSRRLATKAISFGRAISCSSYPSRTAFGRFTRNNIDPFGPSDGLAGAGLFNRALEEPIRAGRHSKVKVRIRRAQDALVGCEVALDGARTGPTRGKVVRRLNIGFRLLFMACGTSLISHVVSARRDGLRCSRYCGQESVNPVARTRKQK